MSDIQKTREYWLGDFHSDKIRKENIRFRTSKTTYSSEHAIIGIKTSDMILKAFKVQTENFTAVKAKRNPVQTLSRNGFVHLYEALWFEHFLGSETCLEPLYGNKTKVYRVHTTEKYAVFYLELWSLCWTFGQFQYSAHKPYSLRPEKRSFLKISATFWKLLYASSSFFSLDYWAECGGTMRKNWN